MVKVRAGSFSGALSADGQLYVWGEGTFGKFYTPHRIKSAKTLDIQDFSISKGGLASVISRSGTCYTWGPNDVGQLGHGDFMSRQTPQRVKQLEGKRVTQLGLGDDFAIALGLTLPQTEYAKLAANNGVLKQRPSTSDGGQRQGIRRIKQTTASSSQKKRINYHEVMQSSAGKPGEDQPLRQKSLTQATTSANLAQTGSLRANKNRTGMSVTSANLHPHV